VVADSLRRVEQQIEERGAHQLGVGDDCAVSASDVNLHMRASRVSAHHRDRLGHQWLQTQFDRPRSTRPGELHQVIHQLAE